MSNYDIKRFKFCFNCNEHVSIITNENFYETEQNFEKNHKNHLVTILTGKEMLVYETYQNIMSKIRKNDVALRNLKTFIDIPNLAENKLIDYIKNENKQLKKQLRQLNDETILMIY